MPAYSSTGTSPIPTTRRDQRNALVASFLGCGVGASLAMEAVPARWRGFLPGFAYQCGVLIAGSVAYLEAIFARRMNYANATAVTALTVFLGCELVVMLAKKKRGIEFGASPAAHS